MNEDTSMMEFKKVICPDPKCNRTITHYIKGTGTDSVYRSNCPKCGKIVLIYSAGKTVLAESPMIERLSIEINIEFH